MAISYDCYPFKPDEFAAAIAPYVSKLAEGQQGLAMLRTGAIALFDSDSNVRKLASEYGGWDRQALTTEENEPTAHLKENELRQEKTRTREGWQAIDRICGNG